MAEISDQLTTEPKVKSISLSTFCLGTPCSSRLLALADRILNLSLRVVAVLTLLWLQVPRVQEWTRLLARVDYLGITRSHSPSKLFLNDSWRFLHNCLKGCLKIFLTTLKVKLTYLSWLLPIRRKRNNGINQVGSKMRNTRVDNSVTALPTRFLKFHNWG